MTITNAASTTPLYSHIIDVLFNYRVTHIKLLSVDYIGMNRSTKTSIRHIYIFKLYKQTPELDWQRRKVLINYIYIETIEKIAVTPLKPDRTKDLFICC